jgi:hypothetical protein
MYKLVSCNVYIVLYSLCSGQFIQILVIWEHSFKYRLTCARKDVFSFRVNFFSKLNAHPHGTWVGIIERMNLNVFQYKLLIIPSNQDNHKSLFVITGLQNVVAYCHKLITSDHPCILHLKPGRSLLESSLALTTLDFCRTSYIGVMSVQ